MNQKLNVTKMILSRGPTAIHIHFLRICPSINHTPKWTDRINGPRSKELDLLHGMSPSILHTFRSVYRMRNYEKLYPDFLKTVHTPKSGH